MSGVGGALRAPRRLLVTGGAGFIGANFLRHFLARDREARVVNLDALTYAGNPENVAGLAERYPGYRFVHGRINDGPLVERLFAEEGFDAVVNFAAESHVDRSIQGPAVFIETNVQGTLTLLEAARRAWQGSAGEGCLFVQVSTDEVYGSLGPEEAAFTERSPVRPNSPYAASKAAADHLVRAYVTTFGLPAATTHCSNNYGPYQHPEKLIPLAITHCLEGRPIPVYGDGQQVRDWLHVEDHCRALVAVLERGRAGERYNIGGANEVRNIELVERLCDEVAGLGVVGESPRRLITFVRDRRGHDRRYAIDAGKARAELGWAPAVDFESGLRETVRWYAQRSEWWRARHDEAYHAYFRQNYGGQV